MGEIGLLTGPIKELQGEAGVGLGLDNFIEAIRVQLGEETSEGGLKARAPMAIILDDSTDGTQGGRGGSDAKAWRKEGTAMAKLCRVDMARLCGRVEEAGKGAAMGAPKKKKVHGLSCLLAY